MTLNLREIVVDGLSALMIESAHHQMTILPELGAKVISLIDKTSNHEYLWRHPGLPFRRAIYGDPFDQYDLSGWDECFPTIGEVVYPAGPWKGIIVPDHGEIWALPWQWQASENELRMWVQSIRFAYRFERTFRFHDDGRIDIDYAVNNPTSFPFQALWSMHPFLKVTPTSRVRLPENVQVRVELSLGERIGRFLSEHPWPQTENRYGQPVDLSLMGPHGQASLEKLYTTSLVEGWAALYDESDGHFLAFTFDPSQVPFTGVCQIRDAYLAENAPTYSTILEPCTGWPDRLDLAITRGACMTIPANGEQRWLVVLHLGVGQAALEKAIGGSMTLLNNEGQT